ncbi:hypothetical protein LTR73_004710 [Friedmanniomyces endolithicus]|nr:hypothetical protein LTR73_004710 [Friedmanniomyces endolithicus]
MNTPCVGSFHSSIDPCYSQSQPTVVPSQLGDQYIAPPYSAFSSPNGGHESVNTSFATTTATTFDSFESTTPPTPEDVYGYRAGDDWELVKAEDLSPGPGMLSHGYQPVPNQDLPHRPRRKNAKRSKARQPRECFTWPNEDGITCEVEGKLCGVGYEIDPVTKKVRYPGISKQLKPHPCNMLDGKTGIRCSARFDRSEHLKRHQAKHSEFRQYMCPIPDCIHKKGMGRGDNAKDHFKTHLKSTAKGRRNKQLFWPELKKALLLKFQDEKVSNNLISNIERWIRTSRDAACQRNRYGEPLTESDTEYLQRLYDPVSIAPQTELISPLILGKQKPLEDLDGERDRASRRPPVKSPGSYRLSGRPPITSTPSLNPLTPIFDGASSGDGKTSLQPRYSTAQVNRLVDQVSAWIKDERVKRTASGTENGNYFGGDVATETSTATDFATLPDLDKLEDIFKKTLNIDRLHGRKSSASLRRRPSFKKLHRKASSISSDTDYFDGEVLVPSSDAALDNSKTLAYTGGASDDSDVSSADELTRTASYRDHDAWGRFKLEIVRLTHTLRLKGWRKVPMDMCHAITVQRLSGALTNSVYVVSPPFDLPPHEERAADGSMVPRARKPPPKLLLRIYGPQVEHLIDREAELAILQRLARKRIGPRMLGTFANGRFEEYFHATTLTPEDLRNPDTSRQIAKRMRELHEGIELLDRERDDGAFVWRNWDKWVRRVEQVVSWLDAQVLKLEPGDKPTGVESWKRRGLICGLPWKQFLEAVEKYRAWLYAQYGGPDRVKNQLVFAHNDTQYGNLLRFVPSGESPLLAPANSHKQLVVIDFEYASANLPGLEFANHFTEWCYNYHDARKPYACNTNRYPTLEEQDRFIRAYVRHRPQYDPATPLMTPGTPPTGSGTPGTHPSRKSTTSISGFFLDARTPSGAQSNVVPVYDQAAEQAAEDTEVARLHHQTRLWRLANTAQWVAWGLVQAKVPGMPDFSPVVKGQSDSDDAVREELGEDAAEYRELAQEESGQKPTEEEQEEFDYLGYAQHRAMWFWGDALQLGIVKAEELPEDVLAKIKTVPY